ncbi:flavin-containing monooxygenase [Siminovitchia sediminis]|uniref:Flavin-containing monooxygenase n=1 Tax=Siminovitchia sediminis TaxID=1274353 RepID=A0ABW4KKA6_9BACI
MYETIIIGAGQAGLAVGYYLQKTGQNFLLIDKAKEIGKQWKNRYDSLVLFTPRKYSSLPGLKLEGEEHGFPSKDEIAVYLQAYGETFNLPIQLNEEVIQIVKDGEVFIIRTNRNEYRSKNVVIATGPFQTPNTPPWSQELAASVNQLHSSRYKNPGQLAEGNVLVVGGGNSGAQIAVELSKERETYLAISKSLHYLPLRIGQRSIFWWFDQLGILQASSHSFLGKLIQKKGDPIFGFELKQAIRQKKVAVIRKVIGARKKQVICEDRSVLEVNNIIWATGFRTEYPWLQVQGVLNIEGKVLHHRGQTNIDGLFFIGLPWQYRRGSALLQGVGEDAKYIASQIIERLRQ